MSNLFKHYVFALSVAALVSWAFSFIVVSPIAIDGGTVRIQDFATYYLLVNPRISPDIGSPYVLSWRLAVLKQLCLDVGGMDCYQAQNATPVGLSPVGLMALKALGLIFGHETEGAVCAYTVMIFVSVYVWSLLLCELWVVRRANRFAWIPILAWLILSGSEWGFLALLQGQPSLLFVGAIGMTLVRVGRGSSPWGSVALVIGSLKPLYALCAFAVIAALRDRRAIIGASVAIVGAVVISMLCYDSGIITAYARSLLSYTQGMPYSWYRNPLQGGHLVSTNRQALFIGGMVIGCATTIVGIFRRDVMLSQAAMIAFLFSSPYVGVYELVLLFVPAFTLCVHRHFPLVVSRSGGSDQED